jgi:hypothetical protein
MRQRNKMPSCRECAARLLRLKAGPLGGLVESLPRINIQMQVFDFAPGWSSMTAGWEGPTPNLVMAVRAQDRSLRRA